MLFDPFITGNPMAKDVDIASVQADLILVSHGHADHIGDCIELAGRTGATVVCAYEIHQWLNRNGVGNTHPMNAGGQWDFGFCRVKAVVAHHSSTLPDGSPGGNPLGFVVRTPEGGFYYSGDTALTMDMQLIPSFVPPRFLILPIGDNFTMGYEDAARAARLIPCGKVIGVHFDTFAPIRIDREKAIRHFESQGLELVLPEIGESFEP